MKTNGTDLIVRIMEADSCHCFSYMYVHGIDMFSCTVAYCGSVYCFKDRRNVSTNYKHLCNSYVSIFFIIKFKFKLINLNIVQTFLRIISL